MLRVLHSGHKSIGWPCSSSMRPIWVSTLIHFSQNSSSSPSESMTRATRSDLQLHASHSPTALSGQRGCNKYVLMNANPSCFERRCNSSLHSWIALLCHELQCSGVRIQVVVFSILSQQATVLAVWHDTRRRTMGDSVRKLLEICCKVAWVYD